MNTRIREADQLAGQYETLIKNACEALDAIIQDRKGACPEIAGYQLRGDSLKAWEALSKLLFAIRCHTTEYGIDHDQQQILAKVGEAMGVDLL